MVRADANRPAPSPVLPGPLTLITGEPPRSAALNMALDEALLRGLAARPEHAAVLRVYRWERPAVSFGYFERWSTVRARFGLDRDCVRRWTGGGVVEHGDGVDWTYSLLLPPRGGGDRGGMAPAAELYRQIHRALAEALRKGLGWSVELAGAAGLPPADGLNACFVRPVRSDVLLAGNGQKVAGAAQRRTRGGLLHQGSVRVSGIGERGVDPGAGWRSLAEGFARELAGDDVELSPTIRAIPPAVLAEAEALAQTRYGAPDWMEKR